VHMFLCLKHKILVCYGSKPCCSLMPRLLFADRAMDEVFDASYVTLHVRVSNKTAFHLYRKTLGYEYAPAVSYSILLFLFYYYYYSILFRILFHLHPKCLAQSFINLAVICTRTP
jgi:hypothetical protein